MGKSGEFSARWRGEGPALSYIRGKAVALYGCEREKEGDDRRESARRREALSLGTAKARGFVACFFDAAAWWREALLFLIAAGWERGKPLPLYCDEWEGDVPAVSNAQRLVDRLQGGQHCRSALEIRSEVSAPALMVPRYLGSVREVSSLLFSGSGGLGLRLEALGNSRCSCPVRACARLNRVPCSSLSGFKLRRALPAPA